MGNCIYFAIKRPADDDHDLFDTTKLEELCNEFVTAARAAGGIVGERDIIFFPAKPSNGKLDSPYYQVFAHEGDSNILSYIEIDQYPDTDKNGGLWDQLFWIEAFWGCYRLVLGIAEQYFAAHPDGLLFMEASPYVFTKADIDRICAKPFDPEWYKEQGSFLLSEF